MKDIECPYCGFEQEINHDDGYGYGEDDIYQQQCGNCDKYFTYTTSISFYYDVKKADCLNEGEHKWEITHAFSVEFRKLRCSDCGEERELPSEETPFGKGRIRGEIDKGKREPEPYPPYKIGTPEANDWIKGWRIGCYGFDRDEES